MSKEIQLFKMNKKFFDKEFNINIIKKADYVGILCNTTNLTLCFSKAHNMATLIEYNTHADRLIYKKSDKYVIIEPKQFKDLVDGLNGEWIEFLYSQDESNTILKAKSKNITNKTPIGESSLYEDINHMINKVIPNVSSEEALADYYGCTITDFSIVNKLVSSLSYSDSIVFETVGNKINIYIKAIEGIGNESQIELDVSESDGENKTCAIHKTYVPGFKIFKQFDLYIHETKPVYAYYSDDIITKHLVISTKNEKEDLEDDESETDYDEDIEANIEDFDLD